MSDIEDDFDEFNESLPSQTGGRMIGDGVYGCVFMPKMKCKPGTTITIKDASSGKKEQLVSKIIDPESASIEFHLSKSISQIPLWKNYFVISESVCTPSIQQDEPDLKKCDALQGESLSSFKMLSMPYRGDSLHLHRFPVLSFDFMKFVHHLIEAGALMTLYNIVHRDLHQGNVLVDHLHVPRIIDFNLSFRADQHITSSALSHRFDPNIAHEPPDSALVNGIYHHKMYKQDPTLAILAIMDKKNILKRIRSVLGGSYHSMQMDLEDFYRSSKSAKTGDTVSWFHMYWSKIDSWAIGVILVDMIFDFINIRGFGPIYAKLKGTLEPILKDMCQVNPIKRIDCVHALNRLDPNNFIIRKYAQNWLNI